MTNAIEAEGLVKNYKTHQALRGVDLAVPEGTVLGLLGPNGAGKTTTVRILSTLLTPDAGTARVAGFDAVRKPKEVRRRIGLTGQYAALDERLTGRENLHLIGTLLHLGRRNVRGKAEELLERFALTDAGDRVVRTYSGGMRRRLDLAASLLVDPPVLFLDEPTTGLDPTSRLMLWGMIREQVDRGVTVLLTTQYLEEADMLADRIVVIDAGKVIAEGTADELKQKVGGERLEVAPALADHTPLVVSALAAGSVSAPVVADNGRTVSVPLTGGMGDVAAAARAVEGLGIDIAEFAVRRPSLDDVFVTLTGRTAEPQEKPAHEQEHEKEKQAA
ncbi:ATP-binding cassette domain-containing protein [Streptomyces antimicrobicus]|uniref:ATP-binding cassette domain-containing protein n=1 Tax=Streptomyces antimicrobicus TaxID=2883108 RepID=A0ABS8BC67_9ACTN|nr:ATP-binding cassette domain-containing protein [Streptomyces antimicrobicus]MCB5182197.1 ATP-binding cassette domain-containing protein [Streptomyces antimicrobicus]